MSVKCGTVTSDGKITSNGNFSCQYDESQQKYTIAYNDHVTNPVPVVSLTYMATGLTSMLNSYSGGFTLQVFQPEGSQGAVYPIACSFNFIIGEIQ
jgi:hypothetical protein